MVGLQQHVNLHKKGVSYLTRMFLFIRHDKFSITLCRKGSNLFINFVAKTFSR